MGRKVVTDTMDNVELQKIEIATKITADYLQNLLDYAVENRMKFMRLDDLYKVHKIKFDFAITEALMLDEDELEKLMADTIKGVARCIKGACEDCGIDRFPTEFLEDVNNQYDWKEWFETYLKSLK